LKYIQWINNLLAKIETTFLILCLSTMILLSFTQVILRNFFSTSLFWGDTFLRHLVLWVAFLGASLATKENRHINIDVLSRVLSPGIKRIADIFTNFFAAVVSFFLMKAAITFIGFEKESGSILFAGIPVWIFQIIIAIGFGLMMFRFFLHALEKLLTIRKVKLEEEPS